MLRSMLQPMLAQRDTVLHANDASGFTFTTQFAATPGVHDGPFVDQYRSSNASS